MPPDQNPRSTTYCCNFISFFLAISFFKKEFFMQILFLCPAFSILPGPLANCRNRSRSFSCSEISSGSKGETSDNPSSVLLPHLTYFSLRFDCETLMRFTLTVRKNYRQVPYHNWSHAFSVAHAMYVILKGSTHHFTHEEVRQ